MITVVRTKPANHLHGAKLEALTSEFLLVEHSLSSPSETSGMLAGVGCTMEWEGKNFDLRIQSWLCPQTVVKSGEGHLTSVSLDV